MPKLEHQVTKRQPKQQATKAQQFHAHRQPVPQRLADPRFQVQGELKFREKEPVLRFRAKDLEPRAKGPVFPARELVFRVKGPVFQMKDPELQAREEREFHVMRELVTVQGLVFQMQEEPEVQDQRGLVCQARGLAFRVRGRVFPVKEQELQERRAPAHQIMAVAGKRRGVKRLTTEEEENQVAHGVERGKRALEESRTMEAVPGQDMSLPVQTVRSMLLVPQLAWPLWLAWLPSLLSKVCLGTSSIVDPVIKLYLD